MLLVFLDVVLLLLVITAVVSIFLSEVMYLDILSQYINQRNIIEQKLNAELRLMYSKRNRLLIDILTDEIKDLDFAIAELRRLSSDKLGYRPRRETILTRPDFYRSL